MNNDFSNMRDGALANRLARLEPPTEDAVMPDEIGQIVAGKSVSVSADDNHAQHLLKHRLEKAALLSKVLRGTAPASQLEAIEQHILDHEAAKRAG